MNFKLNNTISNEINTLIIGIPEHFKSVRAH
ncbi:cytosol aminopeptidase [Staphylococcus aureus]|uniref:Cytosol aminopeptidase n=1 Tax=Staphylococcus aureus TaxID=1280 RepID=A0A2X2JTA3_STAAU|nr:cytosol aminopeptidase [Staphylococcus aureus]